MNIGCNTLPLAQMVPSGTVNIQGKADYEQPTNEARMSESAFADFEFVIRGDGDIYEPNKQPRDLHEVRV